MHAAVDPHGGLPDATRGRHAHFQEEQVLAFRRLADSDVLGLKMCAELKCQEAIIFGLSPLYLVLVSPGQAIEVALELLLPMELVEGEAG